MLIEDLILSKQDIKQEQDKAKEINVYRIILLLCSTFTLILRYLFVKEFPESFDPLGVRVAFSCMLLVIFLLTYFQNLEKFIIYLNYLVFIGYSLHGVVLIFQNNFAIPYILEFIILVIIICLAFKNKLHINIYLSLVFLSFSIACFFFIESLIDVFVNISLLGIICGAILVFFDLKIETEEELRIREDLLNTVFNESPDSLFLIDPQSALIINCNDRALSMFDLVDQQKIIGNNLNYLLKYPYSPGSWKNLKKKVGKKRFLIHELEFKTTSNHVFWGSQAVTEINVGNILYWLVRISDITERVKDKRTIEENRKMLRQVVDLVPSKIFLKDNFGRFMLVNKAVADSYGVTSDDMIGKLDLDFSIHDEAKKFMEDDREVIDKGIQKIIPEEFLTDKNGDVKILNTIKIPFYIDGEDKPGILGIAVDVTERVRDKQIIEENTKMLRQIIDLVPHLIYLKDNHGRFMLVNQAVADLHGLSKEELIGKKDKELFNSNDARLMEAVDADVISNGRTKFIPEEVMTDKEGNVKVMNTIKMPFYLSDRKEVGLLGVNIDITEEKLAEKALKENEAKYRMLMEQASDGIYLSDKDGNILDANLKACDMFGYNMDEFLKLNIKRLVDPIGFPDSIVRVPDNKDRQSIIVERRFIKKDGTNFTVELSAKLLDDGSHQAIIRDITERKKVERILKDNERKFRALIENSSDIVMILGENFGLKYISPSVTRILGMDPEKVINTSIFELTLPDEIDHISKFLSDIISKPEENHFLDEVRIRTYSNDFIYAEVVATNMLMDPIINGIVVNCHDITKRKNTEKELLNTNFELDSFVYKASHDLKAPLRSVMGLIKLAKLESKDQQQHLYLDMMNKSVLSLDQFIKDLTQFSRNSRMEIEAKAINFEGLINDSLSNLKFMDNGDKIVVYKKMNIQSIFYSDLTRLSTVFNNLLSNGFKYHRFENNNPYINITIEVDRDKSKIIVEDNGQGIDPLHVDRIFEMFYRASETSYGSGLGLYIVKNAVNKLNGTISVQSVVNQGTKFIVVIPNLINKVEKNEG
jgi:PAS domain S-box-containing protein